MNYFTPESSLNAKKRSISKLKTDKLNVQNARDAIKEIFDFFKKHLAQTGSAIMSILAAAFMSIGIVFGYNFYSSAASLLYTVDTLIYYVSTGLFAVFVICSTALIAHLFSWRFSSVLREMLYTQNLSRLGTSVDAGDATRAFVRSQFRLGLLISVIILPLIFFGVVSRVMLYADYGGHESVDLLSLLEGNEGRILLFTAGIFLTSIILEIITGRYLIITIQQLIRSWRILRLNKAIRRTELAIKSLEADVESMESELASKARNNGQATQKQDATHE